MFSIFKIKDKEPIEETNNLETLIIRVFYGIQPSIDWVL